MHAPPPILTISIRARGARTGAVHPPVKRLIVIIAVFIVLTQLLLSYIDLDAPFADPITAAAIKVKIGKPDQALILLEHFTADHPDRPKGFLALGNLLVSMPAAGALDRAERAFHDAAYGVNPAPTTTQERMAATMAVVSADSLVALRQAGLLAGLRGRTAAATVLLDQAVAGGDLVALRVLALSAVARDLPTGDSLLQTAVLKSPSDAALLLNIAALWTASPQPERAKPYLRQLGANPESRPGADAWTQYSAARLAARQGDDERAAACLAAAQRAVDPAHIERALPLSHAEVVADPAFHDAGPRLRSVIARWPLHAPWADRS